MDTSYGFQRIYGQISANLWVDGSQKSSGGKKTIGCGELAGSQVILKENDPMELVNYIVNLAGCSYPAKTFHFLARSTPYSRYGQIDKDPKNPTTTSQVILINLLL